MQLLDNFGHMSLRRFITFFNDVYSVKGNRRSLKGSNVESPAMMRGALMRAARQPDMKSSFRALEVIDEPLIVIKLNEMTNLTFDYNFGDGQKDLLFGVQFHYYAGDSLADS